MDKITGSFSNQLYKMGNLQNKVSNIEKSLEKTESHRDKKLYQACEEFEAIFYQLMLKEMRKTVHKSGLTDGGFAEEVFESMIDEEIAKNAAKRNGNLANVLYQQLRLQLDVKE